MYKYELHMHTSESSKCGHCTIGEIIHRYWELGYTGAVIANHFYRGNTCIDRELPWEEFVEQYSRCYYEGQKIAEELDFDLLFGVEEGYGGGKEFLVYGIEPQFLKDRPQLRGATLEVWSKEVREHGGFLAYAHPFRTRAYIENSREIPDVSLVDGIELYNYGDNQEDQEKALEIFGNSSKVLIAGSDKHGVNFEDANGILLPRRARTGTELVSYLKTKNFSIALGKKE